MVWTKKAKTPEFLDNLEEEEENDINGNAEDRNPFYDDSSETEEETSLQEEMEAELHDTVPDKDYVARDQDDFSEEDEVILKIQEREEQRKKNLQKHENRQSMLREINNL